MDSWHTATSRQFHANLVEVVAIRWLSISLGLGDVTGKSGTSGPIRRERKIRSRFVIFTGRLILLLFIGRVIETWPGAGKNGLSDLSIPTSRSILPLGIVRNRNPRRIFSERRILPPLLVTHISLWCRKVEEDIWRCGTK